jgi:hypothetical protein
LIDHCFNSACNWEMRYLRDGRVMRVIRGKDEQASMEHYWLCGHCYQLYDFVFPPDGTVALGNKGPGEHADEFYFRDVRLPERRSKKRAPGDGRDPIPNASSLSH